MMASSREFTSMKTALAKSTGEANTILLVHLPHLGYRYVKEVKPGEWCWSSIMGWHSCTREEDYICNQEKKKQL